MSSLVDSHCHLDFAELGSDRDAVIARAKAAGVTHILTIATSKEEFATSRAIAHTYDHVYYSVGVHPEGAETSLTVDELTSCCRDEKAIGIGETGLDFFYDSTPRDAQERCFRTHIRASIETELPLIIHSREAEIDTMRILESERAGNEKKMTGVLHCFSSQRQLAEEALAIGFYISFSGILTFKKSQELREIAKNIPMDRLLVETDAPFLAPQSHRGKPCEPAYVVETAQVLADVKGVSFDVMAAQTTENFFRLFGKAAP